MDKIIDSRDQKFVLFEMLKIQDLFQYDMYKDMDRDTIEMALDLMKTVCEEEGLPTHNEGEEPVPNSSTDLLKFPSATNHFTRL